ncbi:putative ATPase [Methylobacter tundripaludum]|uniref:Putative ATPase n=1 Tax=Methylobacter tundripaludum TaxID=173365 RepID=A0A2S6HJZ7_9GAMM|nr:AAA family ATPase [Methylobacter tundripaludum]PPK77703.1 putative ATPase [Methylobacter tundripaludum]
MIRKLHINNYKSLHELTLDVGRFNVFIGENGCGKSNLLEAIALVAAAAADKLDHEFLGARGIRVTEPQLMRSGFSDESLLKPIRIGVNFENLDLVQKYTLINDNQPYAKWTRLKSDLSKDALIPMNSLIKKIIEEDMQEEAKELFAHTDNVEKKINVNKEFQIKLEKNIIAKAHAIYGTDAKNYLEHYGSLANNEDKLKNFIIYSPENTALRNFYKEGQIEPLGINGEGLFKLLKVIQSKSPEQRQDIHTSLQLFDWYAELEIPKDLSQSEDKVTITDRYLTLAFDQRSANEGFLFVLFYIALMVSDDTPKIFAIDNIDTSLNPKLCTKLIKELVRLAKKYDKQVFVTTHNPAILDGIDLADDEQRLLVVSRNKQGHTRYKRITLEDKPRSSTNEDLKLSEAFLRGYLGGLPKGF